MSVLKLDDYRKKSTPARVNPPDAPRWFCMGCDGDVFKLYADRTAYCANCGSHIRNVTVTKSP